MAEPARTRRSSRETTVPVAATVGNSAGVSRAELRRRAIATGEIARPAVVWARDASVDAAAPAAVAPVISAPVEETPAEVAPIAVTATAPTRRSRVRPAPLAEPAQTEPAAAEARAAEADAETPAGEQPAEAEPAADEQTVNEDPADAVLAGADSTHVESELAAAEATPEFELIEPEVEPDPVAAPTAEPAPPLIDDEFEAAARLWGFTGETPIQKDAEPAATPPLASTPHVVPRGRGRSRTAVKRMAATSFSMGVMTIVGLLTVGMTTPAEAVAALSGSDVDATISIVAPGSDEGSVEPEEIQAFVAPAQVENAELGRTENYNTVTIAEIASEEGIKNFSNFFVNDPNSPIQWPFAVGVSISYGFGMRSGQMHEGLDFTPGAGAPIQAIADGVVRISTDSGGAYGVTILIDHVIDGQVISSRYAHMQYGSRQVQAGDHVTVGTVIGHTGNTGRSFGAHTHFEILMNGTTPVDPLPWLRQHAGG